MTLALIAIFRDKGDELPSATLSLGHLISLWGHVPPTAMPSTAIAGLMLSLKKVYTADVILDKTNPWDFARRIKADLQGFVPPSVPQMILGFMLPKWIRPKIESTPVPTEYAKLNTSASLSISNNLVYQIMPTRTMRGPALNKSTRRRPATGRLVILGPLTCKP